MKRFLPFSFIPMLMLLHACGTVEPVIPDEVGTAVAQTQTASVWTPTATATPDPNEAKIVEWLNEGFSAMDPLERTMDAQYQMLDVSFLPGLSAPVLFRLDMRCECPMNAQCCVPERMFVIAMRMMKKYRDNILGQVPGSVTEVHLVCYNHQTLIGVMVAGWGDVKSYLHENINGFQLGSRIYKTRAP